MNDKQEQLKIIGPKMRRGIEDIRTEILHVEHEDYIKDSCISGCRIENQAAAHVSFEGVFFRNVEFANVVFDSLELTDVRFESCDLSNTVFSGAIIHRTEFINCKLVGLNLNNSTLQNVYMKQCNGRFALMSEALMKRTILEDCIFENSSFQSSRFDKVQFRSCNLRLSRMSGTSLSGIDLSSSNLEGLCIQIEDLKGAIVTPMQAVDFAKLLGLVVKE